VALLARAAIRLPFALTGVSSGHRLIPIFCRAAGFRCYGVRGEAGPPEGRTVRNSFMERKLIRSRTSGGDWPRSHEIPDIRQVAPAETPPRRYIRHPPEFRQDVGLEQATHALTACARGPATSRLRPTLPVFGKLEVATFCSGGSGLVTEPTVLQKLGPSHRGLPAQEPFLVMDATLP
jgi:hypothetical protein